MSSHGCNWGLRVPVQYNTVHGSRSFLCQKRPKQVQNNRRRRTKISQVWQRITMYLYCVAPEGLSWTVTQPAYALSPWKAIIKYLRAFEGRITAACCIFVPQLTLTEPPDNNISVPKWLHTITILFLFTDRALEAVHRYLAFLLLPHE